VFHHPVSGFHPCNAAVAGGEDGYLILQWPAYPAIAELIVDTKNIEQHTQRAVIVTQQSQNAAADFYLRYFAPQHGVNEDSVTGSANRVLASFWHERLNKSQFKAIQCSEAGGVVYSRIHGHHPEKKISIGGMLTVLG